VGLPSSRQRGLGLDLRRKGWELNSLQTNLASSLHRKDQGRSWLQKAKAWRQPALPQQLTQTGCQLCSQHQTDQLMRVALQQIQKEQKRSFQLVCRKGWR